MALDLVDLMEQKVKATGADKGDKGAPSVQLQVIKDKKVRDRS